MSKNTSPNQSDLKSGFIGLMFLGALAYGAWLGLHKGDEERERRQQFEQEQHEAQMRWETMLPVALTLSEEFLSTAVQFRVLVADDVVGVLDAAHLRFEVPANGVSELMDIRVQQFTPDGWADVPFERWTKYRTSEMQSGLPIIVLENSYYTQVELLIDNRGQETVVLKCGELEFEVEGDRHERIHIPLPRETAHANFAINHEVVGQLPLAAELMESEVLATPRWFLIDTTGRRTYRLNTVSYSTFPTEEPWDPEYLAFARKHLHPINERVDHFLESAPFVIDGYGRMTRTELVESFSFE